MGFYTGNYSNDQNEIAELKWTIENSAVKRVRQDTERGEKDLKKVRVNDGNNKQPKRSDEHATVDERQLQSVMATLFSEEKDSVQEPANVPHPFADCNVPNAHPDVIPMRAVWQHCWIPTTNMMGSFRDKPSQHLHTATTDIHIMMLHKHDTNTTQHNTTLHGTTQHNALHHNTISSNLQYRLLMRTQKVFYCKFLPRQTLFKETLEQGEDNETLYTSCTCVAGTCSLSKYAPRL